MEVLRPFWYWTLWMTKRHTLTLHHVITVYHDMFNHMDGVMSALAKGKSQWKEDLFFAVKLAWQQLSNHYAEVTPMTDMLHISAHIVNPFWKLWAFRKWNKGLDINSEDKTSYTTQYQESFLKYVENEYCAKHRHVTVNKPECVPSNILVPSATPSVSGLSSFYPYYLSSDGEESLTPKNVPEPTAGWSNRATRILTAARLDLNSPPEAPKNWGQIDPNLDDYHSNPMEISSTFGIPDITDWWCQQKETHSRYPDHSNVERNIFSIIPQGVGVAAGFSLG